MAFCNLHFHERFEDLILTAGKGSGIFVVVVVKELFKTQNLIWSPLRWFRDIFVACQASLGHSLKTNNSKKQWFWTNQATIPSKALSDKVFLKHTESFCVTRQIKPHITCVRCLHLSSHGQTSSWFPQYPWLPRKKKCISQLFSSYVWSCFSYPPPTHDWIFCNS